MFELIQPTLSDVLRAAQDGKLQLPDFQRGWVWEEDAIASLVASVARSFPIGALLTLQTGGEIRFAPRVVEGAPEAADEPDELLLDGQQRVTSLFQALVRPVPVDTRTAQGRKRAVFYYLNIERALEDPFPDEAVEIVDHSKTVRADFGRKTVLDLSTGKGEYANMRFPVNLTFDSDDWFHGWMDHWDFEPERIKLFQRFKKNVLDQIASYALPMIRLGKDTTKEAVCLVFEKVNTGGQKLDAFELLTATFAAAGTVNLRADWYGERRAPGRKKRLHELAVLKGIDRTDFLRAVSLAHTYTVHRAAKATGQEPPVVSCNHAAVLNIPVEAYERWCEAITAGFKNAARFLHGLGLYRWRDVPYVSQVIALAALYAVRGNEPLSAVEARKVRRWFWCGIFGELYGSSTETRIANDVEDLTRWLGGDVPEPRTIGAATFSESRLDTLYTRNSAAYKGIHALLMYSGAADFLTGERIDVANYFSENFDIHHIFPRSWCENHAEPKIAYGRYNTIVNKTAISARTNRKIGGRAPSEYCATLDKDTNAADVALDVILEGHLIDPDLLRADDFDGFYAARKTALVEGIETAMGKAALRDGTGRAEDYDEEQEVPAIA
ncbi:MAG: DUF262 domain-containing protein [Chloroflexota bacterium]|nr:DUF262 domain-containing protein [Chloroflexota bacterium]